VKVGKKFCPVGCLSLVLLKLTGQTFFPTFPKEFFKPKVAIAEFFWRMKRKTWYSILRVDVMPLFLKNLLLSKHEFSFLRK
jgi:hypothetical protein